MPSSACKGVLIEKGNYLYNTKGKKVSSNVSIMLTCDRRINESKTVIDKGAENTYTAGTITK